MFDYIQYSGKNSETKFGCQTLGHPVYLYIRVYACMCKRKECLHGRSLTKLAGNKAIGANPRAEISVAAAPPPNDALFSLPFHTRLDTMRDIEQCIDEGQDRKKKSVTRARNRKKNIPIDGAPDFREILVYRVVNAANLVAKAKLQRNAVYVELCGYFSFSRKLLFSFYFSLGGGMATRCYFRSILILLQTRIAIEAR